MSPERCKLAPDEVADLEVTFSCGEPGTLATTIEIQVGAGGQGERRKGRESKEDARCISSREAGGKEGREIK